MDDEAPEGGGGTLQRSLPLIKREEVVLGHVQSDHQAFEMKALLFSALLRLLEINRWIPPSSGRV